MLAFGQVGVPTCRRDSLAGLLACRLACRHGYQLDAKLPGIKENFSSRPRFRHFCCSLQADFKRRQALKTLLRPLSSLLRGLTEAYRGAATLKEFSPIPRALLLSHRDPTCPLWGPRSLAPHRSRPGDRTSNSRSALHSQCSLLLGCDLS